jgi:hypothetical protein
MSKCCRRRRPCTVPGSRVWSTNRRSGQRGRGIGLAGLALHQPPGLSVADDKKIHLALLLVAYEMQCEFPLRGCPSGNGRPSASEARRGFPAVRPRPMREHGGSQTGTTWGRHELRGLVAWHRDAAGRSDTGNQTPTANSPPCRGRYPSATMRKRRAFQSGDGSRKFPGA